MSNEEQQEQYSHGYSETARRQTQRTAQLEGGYLLPHLKPGMKLLDCGCGFGSITIGLAQAVSPGETVGVDFGEEALRYGNLQSSL